MTQNAWNTDQLNANGEMLIGNGSNPPSAGTLTGGTNCTIVNGANSSQITYTGSTTGGWVLISSQTASSASSVEFTGLSSTYHAYVLVVTAYIPGTDNNRLLLGFSTDNGSTWDTTSTIYFRGWSILGNGTTSTNDSDITETANIIGSASVAPGNATGESSSCVAWIFNPSATDYLRVTSYSAVIDTSAEAGGNTIMSGRETASAVNAVRCVNLGSNLSGEFRLYGVVAS